MNYEQIKQTQNSLPFIRYGLVFLFLQLLIALILLVGSWYFVGSFFGKLGFLSISSSGWKWSMNISPSLGFKLDFRFWMSMVILTGGQFVLNLKLWEYWDHSFINFQQDKYMSKPEHQKMTFKLTIPPNYDYTNHKIKILFAFFFNIFRASNININTAYNEGKWFHNLSFDYIIENGQITSYITFPKKMAIKILEAFKIVFPEIKLSPAKDPFKSDFFQNGNQNINNNIAGFSVAPKYSNLISPAPLEHLTNNKKQINNLLQYIKNNSNSNTNFNDNSATEDVKYIVQYNFRFDDRTDYQKYHDEFDVLLQELFVKYGAKKLMETLDKTKDPSNLNEEMFHTVFPQAEQDRLNIMFNRLRTVWWHCSLRVMAIHNPLSYSYNSDDLKLARDQSDDFLDKAFRTIFDTPSESQSSLEKKYLTATNQSYFNHKTNFQNITQPETAHLYDNFYFPNLATEPYIAPFYNNFYFPNENKHRRLQLYRTLLKRDVMAPWGGNTFLVDLNSITGCFQFPS